MWLSASSVPKISAVPESTYENDLALPLGRSMSTDPNFNALTYCDLETPFRIGL